MLPHAVNLHDFAIPYPHIYPVRHHVAGDNQASAIDAHGAHCVTELRNVKPSPSQRFTESLHVVKACGGLLCELSKRFFDYVPIVRRVEH